MNDFAIQTTGLHKMFGSKVAVADLTLAVPHGEVFGFLGPNGAGKSTSVKMLLGLVAPTNGHATVLGEPLGSSATRRHIGFLPEHFRFHEWLQARELLDLHARLYGIDAATRRKRIPELLDRVGLSNHAHRPIAGFSKGMLQRIGLAQALLNEPQLVFLDEPTSALDPFGRMLVRTIIHELRERGTTVFLNSHLLGEVEATCDRVTFIKEGRVLQTLVLDDIGAGRVRVELRVGDVTPALLHMLDELSLERNILGSSDAAAEPTLLRSTHTTDTSTTVTTSVITRLELVLDDEELVPLIAERVVDSGARLYSLTPQRMSLEQLFLDIVGREDSGQ